MRFPRFIDDSGSTSERRTQVAGATEPQGLTMTGQTPEYLLRIAMYNVYKVTLKHERLWYANSDHIDKYCTVSFHRGECLVVGWL